MRITSLIISPEKKHTSNIILAGISICKNINGYVCMLYKLAEWDDMNIKYIECVYVWRVLRKEIKERGCFGKNVLSMGIWLGSFLH